MSEFNADPQFYKIRYIEYNRRANPEKFSSTKNPALPPWITMVFSTATANLVQFLQFLFTI